MGGHVDNNVDDARNQHHVKHRGWTNQRMFWVVWFLVAVFVLTTAIRRASGWLNRRVHRNHRYSRSTQPSHLGALARGVTFVKTISGTPFPRFTRFTGPAWTWSRLALLTSYVAIIASLFAAVDAPMLSQHFLDDLAFRAAWIALTQIPLVYLLSTKRGPINILAGLSHERINWMHRWIGGILFFSVTTHMAIMKSSISMQDILKSHENEMQVVRHGIGAYSILAWIVIASILSKRRLSYRLFYVNHWVSTIAFLSIVFQHIPSHARTPIYLASSLVALDKCLVGYYFCRNNISIRPVKHNFAKFSRGPRRSKLIIGYPVEMTAPSPSILGLSTQTTDTTTIIRITDIPFSWKPGQHVRLYIPALGAFEMHPFTPANCSAIPAPPLPPRKDIEQRGSAGLFAPGAPAQSSEMLLIMRAHSGLTLRMADYYADWLKHPCPNASYSESSLVAYIDGPYGNAPAWEEYANLVLVATSTGISFILAIADRLEQLCFMESSKRKTRTMRFTWAVRHVDPQLERTVEELLVRYSTMLRESDIKVEVEFYTTCSKSMIGFVQCMGDQFAHLRRQTHNRLASKPRLRIRNPDDIYDEWDREALKVVEPFGSDFDENEWYSFGSDGTSDVSTLVDGHYDDDHAAGPLTSTHATSQEDTAYRPLPPSPPSRREKPTAIPSTETPNCQCALIQDQRRKLNIVPRSYDFITRNYGTRPNISAVISEAIPRTMMDKTMVAVCANDEIACHARRAVAKMNLEFALGKRDAGVDIFVEGFG